MNIEIIERTIENDESWATMDFRCSGRLFRTWVDGWSTNIVIMAVDVQQIIYQHPINSRLLDDNHIPTVEFCIPPVKEYLMRSL